MSPHKVMMMTSNGSENERGEVEQPKSKRTWILGDKFGERMPHHDGIEALWETKWKFPCTKSVYPFHDGEYEDFEPVFRYLIENNINDGTSPAYTSAFFTQAEKLTAEGDAAVAATNPILASELYLRAACLYRIARFPYISDFPKVSCEVKWRAWQAQKKVYMKAACLWEKPVKEVLVPHSACDSRSGDREGIPVYVRLPRSVREGRGNGEAEAGAGTGTGERRKVPVVILMTGLDGYRPDNTQRLDEFTARGWASVVAEVPGTADCPADPRDPESPDRLWTSVLDWMEKEDVFDMSRVMVWGLSTGGYYAVRVAHTHKERLKGVVAQGAGVHLFFDKEWMLQAEGREYPFALAPAMALKHGYESVDEFREEAQRKFSLLETGIIQKPSTRLLLVNGTHDGLMPIEDSMLLFEHGSPKEARFFSEALHMGYPLANSAVYPWMESVMAGA